MDSMEHLSILSVSIRLERQNLNFDPVKENWSLKKLWTSLSEKNLKQYSFRLVCLESWTVSVFAMQLSTILAVLS